MWPDVYLSSHRGHKLARAGGGWHTAFPPMPLPNPPNPDVYSIFYLSPEPPGRSAAGVLPLLGQAVQTWSIRGLVCLSDSFPSSNTRVHSHEQKYPSSSLVFRWPCSPGKRMSTVKLLCVRDAMWSSGKPARLEIWSFFLQDLGSITSSVTLGT